MPDDDPGPDDGHRDAGRSEQLSTSRRLRRCADRSSGVAEPAEVDDALQPGPRGRLAERRAAAASLRSKSASLSECTR